MHIENQIKELTNQIKVQQKTGKMGAVLSGSPSATVSCTPEHCQHSFGSLAEEPAADGISALADSAQSSDE